MANLLASIDYDHHNRYIHRLGHRHIATSAQTWEGRADVYLAKDGEATIEVGPKDGYGMTEVWRGNVNETVQVHNWEAVLDAAREKMNAYDNEAQEHGTRRVRPDAILQYWKWREVVDGLEDAIEAERREPMLSKEAQDGN